MNECDSRLFEAVPCGIVQYTVEEMPHVLVFNSACAQIYGYTSKLEFEQETKGFPDKMVYSYDLDFWKGYVRRAIRTGQIVNFGHRILRKNQMIGYIIGTLQVVTLEDGTQVLQSIFQDSGQHIMQADIQKSIYYQSVQSRVDTKKIILAESDEEFSGQIETALRDSYTIIKSSQASEILSVLKKEGEEIAAILGSAQVLIGQDYRFIATLRGNLLYATIPVVVFADVTMPMEEILSYGVNEVIYPPYNLNVIRMRLTNLIELRNTAVQRNAIETLMNNLSGGVLIFCVGTNSISQVYYTDGILTLSGWERQEMESMIHSNDFDKLIYEKDSDRCKLRLQQAASDGTPLEMTFRVRQKNGSLAWIHMHGTKLRQDKNGAVYQCILSPTSAGEKLYMEIMNDSFNGIIVYGERADDLLYFNNAAIPFLGVNLQEAFDGEELSDREYIQKQLLLTESHKHITLNGKQIDWNGIRARIIYITDDTDSYRIQLERHQLYEMEREKMKEQSEQILFSAIFNLNQDSLMEVGTNCLLDLENNRKYSIDSCVQMLAACAADSKQAEMLCQTFNTHKLRKAYMNGDSRYVEQFKIKRADGGYRWIAVSWVLVENPVTLEVSAFVYVYDVDWEVLRTESFTKILGFEEEYVACLDISSQKVHLMELTEQSQMLDRGLMVYDEFREKYWENLADEKERTQLKKITAIPYIQERLETESVYYYYYQIRKADEQRCRYKKVRVFYLDETRDVLCFTRTDVTDFQEEQQLQNERLEEALSEAEQANMAKSMFMSRMSHDIRTPMNAILGMTRLALERYDNNKAVREYLEKIQTSGDYLLGLINDILDMSRIESDRVRLDMEPYSVRECVEMVLVTLKMQIEEKAIQFTYTESDSMPDYVMLDKMRMQQIFFNLISNAVKFSKENGRIQVIVNSEKAENGIWNTEILICDEGIGIAKEEQTKVFEPFEQGSNQGELRWQGTGLGLAIVKNLVRLMEGTIEVESDIGEGTTFILKLPLTEVTEGIKEQSDGGIHMPDGHDFNNLKVLLVEDNVINMEIARTMLQHKGCIVDEAINGQEAVEKLENSEPGEYGIVFMDIQMPVMNGLEATRKIRTHSRTDLKQIPVIAMTANAFAEDIQKSRQAGMNAYITKPVDMNILYDTMYQILKIE